MRLSEVSLVPSFNSFATGDWMVWVPDAVSVEIHDGTGTGEVRRTFPRNTSLEYVFMLLNQLESGESGSVPWGSSFLGVSFADDEVSLRQKDLELIGTPNEARLAVEALAKEIFLECGRQSVDTREIAEQLRAARKTSWALDPVVVHDRLLDEE